MLVGGSMVLVGDRGSSVGVAGVVTISATKRGGGVGCGSSTRTGTGGFASSMERANPIITSSAVEPAIPTNQTGFRS